MIDQLTLVDIFFLITGSAVVIITILMVVGLLYILTFLRTIKKIAQAAHKASEGISEDIIELRKNIKQQGFGLGTIFSFIKDLAGLKGNKKK